MQRVKRAERLKRQRERAAAVERFWRDLSGRGNHAVPFGVVVPRLLTDGEKAELLPRFAAAGGER